MTGKLWARVYLHDTESRSGPMNCWSYVSTGMAAVDQAEIVFTLRRDPDESSTDFPHDPLHLLATVYQLADQGTRVGPGAVTEFGDRSFLGHHLLYVEAQPLGAVPLPPGSLTALLITTDELRAVREFGPTRVLARMGQAAGYYPFPPWSDRRSPGLSLSATFENSVLSQLPRTWLPDARVRVTGNQITLSTVRGEGARWQELLEVLPGEVPPALLTELDPAADGCLVWVPGQSGPEAITSPGTESSRLCACFVVFVPAQPENGGRILEDGVAVELTADSWKMVRGALIDGRKVEIPADGTGMSFVLTWRDHEDVAVPPTGRVTITLVRLLTPEPELAARSSADELAAFCRQIQRCLLSAVADRIDAGQLLVRMQCTSEGHDVKMSSRGDMTQPVMQEFFEAVSQLDGLPVQGGEVSFEIELSVSPARTESSTPPSNG
ncbi:MAG: suppressor of fused domain protein [Mycobacterium sp.]